MKSFDHTLKTALQAQQNRALFDWLQEYLLGEGNN